MALGAPGTHSQRTERVKGCLWAFSQVGAIPPAPGLELLYTRHRTEFSLSWSALFTPPALQDPQAHHGVGGGHGPDLTCLWPGPCLGFGPHVCTLRLQCLGGECCVTHLIAPLPLPSRGDSSVPSPTAGPRLASPSSQAGRRAPPVINPLPPLRYPWEQLENGSSPCPAHAQAQAPD